MYELTQGGLQQPYIECAQTDDDVIQTGSTEAMASQASARPHVIVKDHPPNSRDMSPRLWVNRLWVNGSPRPPLFGGSKSINKKMNKEMIPYSITLSGLRKPGPPRPSGGDTPQAERGAPAWTPCLGL